MLAPYLLRVTSRVGNLLFANLQLAREKSEEARAEVLTLIRELPLAAHGLPLSPSLRNQIARLLEDPGSNERLSTVAGEITVNFLDELADQLFLFVPATRVQWYEREELFGPEVHERFASGSFHVREAGTCLALARPTAAVFHLMCVLEVGLDSLAYALGLQQSRKDWHQVLRDIETNIKDVEDSVDREFYGRAALEFRFLKDAWRNHTQHGRAKYTETEAEKILAHVKSFMVHLATRLQERPSSS